MTANQLVGRVSFPWIWGLFWDHAGWCLVIRSAEGTKQKNYHTRAADSRWTPTCSICLMSVSDHLNILSPFFFSLHSHTHNDISTHVCTPEYPEFMFYPIFYIVCFWRQSLKSIFTAIIKAVNLYLKSCVTFILRPRYILWLH